MNVAVGDWVRVSYTGKEGLVVRYNPMSGWFEVEYEDGSLSAEQADVLEKIA